MQKEHYTTHQAAQVLGVSASSVRKMIHSGELMAHKDEQGHHRIPPEALHAMREEELQPLARRLLSAEESRDALAEERTRLRGELERERRRAEGLTEELEDFNRKWWATRHESM